MREAVKVHKGVWLYPLRATDQQLSAAVLVEQDADRVEHMPVAADAQYGIVMDGQTLVMDRRRLRNLHRAIGRCLGGTLGAV